MKKSRMKAIKLIEKELKSAATCTNTTAIYFEAKYNEIIGLINMAKITNLINDEKYKLYMNQLFQIKDEFYDLT